MSNKTQIQDKKDLEKFIKFLALKSAQVIVQSRLGEKIQTLCNSHTSGNDWVSVSKFELIHLCFILYSVSKRIILLKIDSQLFFLSDFC